MQLRELFVKAFQNKPRYEISAAGRINQIGEHVDYCGGAVLPAALNLKCTALARANGTNRINIYADDLQICESLDIDRLADYKRLRWGSYQAGVAYVLQKNGYPLVGCDILYSCTVPFGSGLSSSAAIEVATAVTMNEVAGNAYDPVEMAVLAQRAENEYCGVNCGIMDQFAAAMGRKNHAVLLDCKTLRYEYVPLNLGKYDLVVANSNKPHSLITSKYNERRSEVEQALCALQKVYPHIVCLADVTPPMLQEANCLSGKIADRAAHVVNECERVRQAVGCLRSGDIPALAELINRSHDSLSELYEVSGKELDALAYLARAQKNCIGARMIGGGFGGCTISLVEREHTERFIAEVGAGYEREIGYRAAFYPISIEDGITVRNI